MRTFPTISLLLALLSPWAIACDADDGGDDDDLDGVMSEASTGADEDEPEATTGDASSSGDDDSDGGSDGEPLPAPRDTCDEYGEAQACVKGGTRYCDVFEGALAWGECQARGECQPGQSRACEGDAAATMGCGLLDGVPTWDAAGCE